jgi:hypothetical protein
MHDFSEFFRGMAALYSKMRGRGLRYWADTGVLSSILKGADILFAGGPQPLGPRIRLFSLAASLVQRTVSAMNRTIATDKFPFLLFP